MKSTVCIEAIKKTHINRRNQSSLVYGFLLVLVRTENIYGCVLFLYVPKTSPRQNRQASEKCCDISE